MSTVIRLLVYCRADCYPRGLFDYVLNMCCPCCVFRSRRSHQRSQDFCWGGAPGRRHPALHQSCTSVKLSRAAGDLWALHHSAESWVEPQNEIKMAKNYRWNDIWGRVFVNVVRVKYIGMIYINVGEMTCGSFRWTYTINCQLKWQHLSPVVSTFSTSSRLLSFFFLKHCILPPSSLSVPSMSRFLHPVFVISGLSLRFRDVDQCFLLAIQSSLQKDTFTIQWLAVNPSSDNFYTDAIVPSSDQYCIETVAPSGDHYCIAIVVPSSDHYGTTKVAPP